MSSLVKHTDCLFEFLNRLYLERLFVLSKTTEIEEVHKNIGTSLEKLVHAFWMKSFQHICINDSLSYQGLFLSPKHHVWIWDSIQFIDCCKVFQNNEESKYSQFFEDLLSNPVLIADCLTKGDEANIASRSDAALTLMLGCYGSDFLTDGCGVLGFLEQLFLREIRKKERENDFIDRESIFHLVFRIFTDMLLQRKSFLMSTLKPIIMTVVRNSKVFLETNQQKLITKLTPNQITRMFGNPENPEFQKSIREYVQHTKEIVMKLCSGMLSNFLSRLSSLPPQLGQIIARMHDALKITGRFSDGEAHRICADIFLTHFIFPAITNPELYGLIDDVDVSDQCRFNLRKIAQTLQALLRKDDNSIDDDDDDDDDDVDEYHDSVLGSLDVLMKSIVENYSTVTESPRDTMTSWSNCAVLVTPAQLNQLVQFLFDVMRCDDSGFDYDLLFDILLTVPEELSSSLVKSSQSDSVFELTNHKDNRKSLSSTLSSSVDTLPGTKTLKKLRRISASSPTLNLRSPPDPDPLYEDEVVLVIPLPSSNQWPGVQSETEFLKAHHVTSSIESSLNHSEESSEDTSRLIQASRNAKTNFLHGNQMVSNELNDDDASYLIQTVHPRFASIIKANSSKRLIPDNHSPSPDSDSCTPLDSYSSTENVRSSKSCLKSSSIRKQKSRDSSPTNHIDFHSETNGHALEAKSPDLNPTDDDRDSTSPSSEHQQLVSNQVFNGCDHVKDDPTKTEVIDDVDVPEGEFSFERTKSVLKLEKMLGVSLPDETDMSKKAEFSRLYRKKVIHKKKFPWKTLRSRTVDNMNNDVTAQVKGNKKKNRSTFSHNHLNSTDRRLSDQVSNENDSKRISTKLGHKSCSDLRHEEEATNLLQPTLRTGSLALDLRSTGLRSPSGSATLSPVSRRVRRMTATRPEAHFPLSPSVFSFDLIESTNQSDVNCSSQSRIDVKDYLKTKLRDIFSTVHTPQHSSLCQSDLGVVPLPLDLISDRDLRRQLLSTLRFHLARDYMIDDVNNFLLVGEAVRCVESMSDVECRAVVESLRRDYTSRSSYIAHLIRTEQCMQCSLSCLRHKIELLRLEKIEQKAFHTQREVCEFLNQKEMSVSTFQRKLRFLAPDERVSAIAKFLSGLFGQWVESSKCKGVYADSSELGKSEALIERVVFTRLYDDVMFPNGQADVERDQLLQRFIASLSDHVTPKHDKLLIPDKYLVSYPWSAAQDQLKALAALSSPMSKLGAVVRCCKVIITLLEMADRSHPPAADDFLPLLVFVIIKANPPHLLSTRSFIDDYIGDRLHGVESYFWITFASALVFINSMSSD